MLPLEITAFTLSAATLFVTLAMLLVGFAGLADPTVVTRCRECAHWMVDMVHVGDPVCFRCRHGHHHRHAVIRS